MWSLNFKKRVIYWSCKEGKGVWQTFAVFHSSIRHLLFYYDNSNSWRSRFRWLLLFWFCLIFDLSIQIHFKIIKTISLIFKIKFLFKCFNTLMGIFCAGLLKVQTLYFWMLFIYVPYSYEVPFLQHTRQMLYRPGIRLHQIRKTIFLFYA